jgi:3-mercaptopyruvate sulfurtransferase SseA
VVVYCDCPDEATAAVLARKLAAQGFGSVRPLIGGFQAWKNAGLPVEHALRTPAETRPTHRAWEAATGGEDLSSEHAFAGGE